MPLSKEDLKNDIRRNLELALSDYEMGTSDAINLDNVIDPLIEHLEAEIQDKLKDIVSILQEMNTATATGMAAITPPGTGAAGASVYKANTSKASTLIASLQTNLNQAK